MRKGMLFSAFLLLIDLVVFKSVVFPVVVAVLSLVNDSTAQLNSLTTTLRY